ncbi:MULTISPECIES: MarC family protein [unclassified Bradyrhizobium]
MNGFVAGDQPRYRQPAVDTGVLPTSGCCDPQRRRRRFFNVGLDDFRIAGGLLALMIAFEMFQAQFGRYIQVADETARDEVDIHGLAITPFAFPLLVGPAELSIMITLSNDNPGWLPKALLAFASVLAAFLIGLTLWMAAAIERFLGRTGITS